MESYLLTLFVFFSSFLVLPLFFLFSRAGKGRKILMGLQIAFFVYWNMVFWGSFLAGEVFYSYAVPRGSGAGGSILWLYYYVTPLYIAFILIELIVIRRAAKRQRQLEESSSPL